MHHLQACESMMQHLMFKSKKRYRPDTLTLFGNDFVTHIFSSISVKFVLAIKPAGFWFSDPTGFNQQCKVFQFWLCSHHLLRVSTQQILMGRMSDGKRLKRSKGKLEKTQWPEYFNASRCLHEQTGVPFCSIPVGSGEETTAHCFSRWFSTQT